MPTTAASYFGSMVDSYDSLIRRAVPRYDEMTDRLLGYLPATAGRIVELGCGTGNLSLHLARRYPNASLMLIDASKEMIDVTRERLSAAVPAVEARSSFLVQRFEQLEFADVRSDVITSCISLHHVKDKGSLYHTLFEMLAAGGTLCFADQLAGATRETHAMNWEGWLEFCRRPGHCTEAELQSLIDHAAAHDHYMPLYEHWALLQAAGFASIDCVWRNLMWGIVCAKRPA